MTALRAIWTTPDPRTLRGALSGDLDQVTGDDLLTELTAQLTPGLDDVRLDCGTLGHCDSYGLSILLMIARRVRASGANLHLDERPPELERLLHQTRTLDFLTARAPAE
ncbi:STAS domain-containing protein [Amycolatopsis endophytica]|uniref:Anti-anti-sigma factor n=1 Tax=Amycolatopsis endophytica TaxID=860233 RepID=A0A853BD17_9PSEU|nr:STAS domain-containing protein [Amycolatopsis endophytica]NYI92561.1 anti-anti-sigma factor [Amycolatopsis endophytica]